MVTRKEVVDKLEKYLHRRLSLKDLVDWAEEAMREEGFEEAHFEEIREVISRLGLADVRAFGLTWEDCQEMLQRLGYHVTIQISEAR